jgi:hypothetical protein
MQLWQMDVTASAFLPGGAEVKIVTGIDDHSRYCVITKAVLRATARPVCQAFIDGMAAYGVPEEVLTDNGKVFTGRFHKPGVAVEVLFDRICRENGITHRLTAPYSPTTTGKIERLHQTLQAELLEPHGPFASIGALQMALDAWRGEYNSGRPHQSLAMAFPASRFTAASAPLDLRIPSQLAIPGPAAPAVHPARPAGPSHEPQLAASPSGPAPPQDIGPAVEADRVVPPSGNLWIGGQQIWLGPAMAGRKVTIWADETTLHVLADGTRIKTLPSRLGITELARLAASGARPAGPPPLPPAAGTAIEVDRLVNATGLASLAGTQISVGYHLAGQRITLRLDGTQMAILDQAGTLLRMMACPVPPHARHKLRGARRATASPPGRGGPVTVQRRVSSRGSIMVATQKIQVGMIHARKTVTVTAEDDRFTLVIDDETLAVVPRTTTREVQRYKAYATQKTSRAWKGSSEAQTESFK